MGSSRKKTSPYSRPVHPAVFLDRDDTLVECNSLPPPSPPAAPGDLIDPALVRLLPGVLGACRRLKAAGFRLVVISNQGTVARGGATLDLVRAVNDRVRALLTDPSTRGGESLIHAVYFCPYHPNGVVPEFTREHSWRKPAPGMLLAAAQEHQLDLSKSWLVGDAPRDVEAGKAAGLPPKKCLLIGTGAPFADLAAAAEFICSYPID